MKKLILIYLLISLIDVGMSQRCFAELNYSSIYQNINYKEHFNADSLKEGNNVYPTINGSGQLYVTDYSEVRLFKAFFPKGARQLKIIIYFFGWIAKRCEQGATIKYWMGPSSTIPSEQGMGSDDLWNGKYLQRIFAVEDNAFSIYAKNSLPSDKAVWIYFEVNNPKECPSYSVVQPAYELDLDKYSEWYNYVTANNRWEANGDPPYDGDTTTPTTKTISLSSSSPSSVNEGDAITYKVTLSEATSTNLTIPYTISGSANINQDYECIQTDQDNLETKCPSQDINSKISGTIVVPAKALEGTLKLKSKEDNSTDGDNNLIISLGSVIGDYTIQNSTVTTTIKDTSKNPTSANIIPLDINIISTEPPQLGGTIIIFDSNKNDGATNSGAFTIDYYLVKSSDKATTMSDINALSSLGIKLHTRTVGNIESQKTDSISDYSITIPKIFNKSDFFDDDLKPYIVKLIHFSNEQLTLTESNFARFEKDFSLPDLYIENIEVTNNPVVYGKPIEITAKIGNSGTASANDIKVDFYIVGENYEIKNLLKSSIPNKDGSFYAQIPAADEEIIILTDNSHIISNDILPDSSTTLYSFNKSITLPANISSTFRILAVVNNQVTISESNRFNNFANKKDGFTSDEINTVEWKDISGASDIITLLLENPNLTLEKDKVNIKDNKLKWLPEEKLTIECQVNNSGSDFTGSPATYISIYLSKDENLDEADNELITKDNIQRLSSIKAGATTPINIPEVSIPKDKVAGKYYLLVILQESTEGVATPTTKAQKALPIDIMKIFSPTKIEGEEIKKEDIKGSEDVPVYLGDIVTGGNNCELTINFPAYSNDKGESQAVDHYIAIVFPNNKLMFVQNNKEEPFTKEFAIFDKKGVTDSINIDKLIPKIDISIGDKFAYNAMQGRWSVYWLTALAGSNDINDIVKKGEYEFHYYTFEVALPLKEEKF
ncbi:MAG: hypothetical protein HQK63_04570 [Desulfamplus sp.]|nr:hypothetical protein [Desulfamplus sp.]